MVTLTEPQLRALDKMHNGCILCGGVGSGKTITSLAYYYLQNGGHRESIMGGAFKLLASPKDLYIITTAHVRDKHSWDHELSRFYMEPGENPNVGCKVTIDSWNNVHKYKEVSNAFFIFDEQRVRGYGQWAKSFIAIARLNEWILLSATPGDNWQHYIPVFIANRFYRNKTHFEDEHCIFDPHVKFRKVLKYTNTGRLIRERMMILVEMDTQRRATSHHEDVWCEYNREAYKLIYKTRWNPYEERPIESGAELAYLLRRVTNESHDRVLRYLELIRRHPKVIVFYSHDYELVLLKAQTYDKGTIVAEWNGHKHEEIPKSEKWVYLVQYTAGAEGWNCIETDTVIFYSQSYSYSAMVQAAGRTDRMNTPFDDLYYYHLKSKSPIDLAISKALNEKKDFNVKAFVGGL